VLTLLGVGLLAFLAWSYIMQVQLLGEQSLLSPEYRTSAQLGTVIQGLFVISIVTLLVVATI